MPQSNRTLVLNLLAIVLGMLLLVAASVPLYRLFCQATGYGGTTKEGTAAPGAVGDRTIAIEFNADIDPGLAWEFKPAQKRITVKIGEQAMTHYVAHNLTNRSLTGHAVYNVTPFAAGPYFVKIQCFCFKEQTLGPGVKANMPVLFYVDPAILADHEMDNVKTITLSYTFFPVKNGAIQDPIPRSNHVPSR